MIVKKIPLQIKPTSYLVVVCGNSTIDLDDYARKMGYPLPEHFSDLLGYTYADSDRHCYVILIHNNTSVGYIAHEVRHFLNYVYIDIGYKYDIKNDELDGCLLGYFVDVIHKIQYKSIDRRIKEDEKSH